MKRLLLLIAALLAASSIHTRSNGIIPIGTGWCNFYPAISSWLASKASFIVQTKAPYTQPRRVTVDGVIYDFYHLPIEILENSHVKVYIAPGTLIDLELLANDLENLEKLGISTKKRIRISTGAQILMPYHKVIGASSRKNGMCRVSGGVRIGTGAANADKCMGIAFRVADLMSLNFKKKLKDAITTANTVITKVHNEKAVNIKTTTNEFAHYRKLLEPYVREGVELKFNQMLSHGKVGIFNSPYDTYLDSTHGSYPYTSGVSSLASSICASAGVGFKRIKTVCGIVDAFAIHPGNGCIITEIQEAPIIEKIQRAFGIEYKKNYKYGWIDLVMIRQAVMINGIDCLAFNGLNLLDDLDEIKMCIDYDVDGKHLDYPTPLTEEADEITPHYITFPGWKESTKNARHFSDLPQNARAFLKQLECMAGAPIALISVGKQAHEMVVVQDDFFY